MNKFLLLCASLSFLLNGAVTMANTANIQENINIDSKSKCISLDIKEVVARHGKQCRNTAVYFNIKNTKPQIFEVFVDKKQNFEPKLISWRDKSGKFHTPSLHEMSPLLSEDELKLNIS